MRATAQIMLLLSLATLLIFAAADSAVKGSGVSSSMAPEAAMAQCPRVTMKPCDGNKCVFYCKIYFGISSGKCDLDGCACGCSAAAAPSSSLQAQQINQ
ncbi:hypothetical protein ACP4OV_022058 [Aristida adscensionis]